MRSPIKVSLQITSIPNAMKKKEVALKVSNASKVEFAYSKCGYLSSRTA